jgi:hypothetical protein
LQRPDCCWHDRFGAKYSKGIALVYELDDKRKPIRHYHLGNAKASAKAVAAVATHVKP